MKVIVRGRVSVYERDGLYQVYAEEMQPDGAGSLAVAFEQLKNRLSNEGIFAAVHKKKLPSYPKRIGVITSPTGAAIQDIINIIQRRWPVATIIFSPVSVQGANAAQEIRTAIAAMDTKACCDVIIVGRGGGSVEDLWSFNDELLVRTIFSCNTPVVSAVGHETDFTLCDFVSDLRAPTPSAAAELVTPDIQVELHRVESMMIAIKNCLIDRVETEKDRLLRIRQTRSFSSPAQFLDHEKQYSDSLSNRLNIAFERYIANQKARTGQAVAKLDALSPLKVLKRGYAVVLKDDTIISGISDVLIGDILKVSMSDGVAHCSVDRIDI